METKVREAIKKHQGISHNIMTIFNYHYDQILREIGMECRRCTVPEDGEAIREFFEEYMEEELQFPPMIWEDFIKALGVDQVQQVKPKVKDGSATYKIPVRTRTIPVTGIKLIVFKSGDHSGYLAVRAKDLDIAIQGYIKYLSGIAAVGTPYYPEDYLCSTIIPDIAERIYTMIYLLKVNDLATPEVIQRYCLSTQSLLDTLNGILEGADFMDPMVVLDTQDEQTMNYYKNLAELYK